MSKALKSSTALRLYKLDSKGKMRYWFAYADGDEVCVSSGIVGREDTSQINDFYTAQPKNPGKKNATTGAEQAEKEVEALYAAKLKKKGYQNSLQGAIAHEPDGVQLAHDYTKKNNHKKIVWGQVDGQVKLDGLRCRIVLDRKAGVLRVWSRQHEHYVLPVTLYTQVLELFKANPTINTLDGELYVHGVDMADIQSMVTDESHPERESLQLWVYDTIASDLEWKDRREILNKINFDGFSHIVGVWCERLDSVEAALKFLDRAIGMGFEGIILRNWKGFYLCGKRSYDLQKWKLFEDAEFMMVDVEIDKRGHGVGVYVTKDGKRFNARWKAPNAKRQDMADHPEKYVNKRWTIRFQKYSLDGIPIFPVAIVIRLDA